jgi:hypothetical protein
MENAYCMYKFSTQQKINITHIIEDQSYNLVTKDIIVQLVEDKNGCCLTKGEVVMILKYVQIKVENLNLLTLTFCKAKSLTDWTISLTNSKKLRPIQLCILVWKFIYKLFQNIHGFSVMPFGNFFVFIISLLHIVFILL